MTGEELRKATYLVRDVVSPLKVAIREFPLDTWCIRMLMNMSDQAEWVLKVLEEQSEADVHD